MSETHAAETTPQGTPGEGTPPSEVPTTPETQPEQTLAGGTAPKAGEGTAPTEGAEPAPALTVESYKDLKFPEGFQVDEERLSAFKESAIAQKIAPEAAQQFVDMYVSGQQSMIEAFQQERNSQVAGWRSESEALPEFQGELRAKSLEKLGKLMEEYGTPETRAIFNETRIGDHPAVVKYLLKMADALTEGEPTPGGKPPPQRDGPRRTPGEIFYPGEPVRQSTA